MLLLGGTSFFPHHPQIPRSPRGASPRRHLAPPPNASSAGSSRRTHTAPVACIICAARARPSSPTASATRRHCYVSGSCRSGAAVELRELQLGPPIGRAGAAASRTADRTSQRSGAMAAENGGKSTASASVGQGLAKLNVDTGSEKVASFLPDAAAAAAAAAAGAAKGKAQASAAGGAVLRLLGVQRPGACHLSAVLQICSGQARLCPSPRRACNCGSAPT